MLARRSTRAALALLLCGASLAACEPEEDDDDIAWLELGQGEYTWQALAAGDALTLVRGQQGLLMFPLQLRGGGFTLPPDPSDFTHPDAPQLDISIDIEGFNELGFGGRFTRISGLPISFAPVGEDTYEFVYVPAITPDELYEPCVIDKQPATIYAALDVVDRVEPVLVELEVVIEVPPAVDDCG